MQDNTVPSHTPLLDVRPRGRNQDKPVRYCVASCINIWDEETHSITSWDPDRRVRTPTICVVRNITNPLLASALRPDRFCNKNNVISPEAIMGETTTVPTQKKLLTWLPPALYQDNQDGCDVKSKGGSLRYNKCLCFSQTLFQHLQGRIEYSYRAVEYSPTKNSTWNPWQHLQE